MDAIRTVEMNRRRLIQSAGAVGLGAMVGSMPRLASAQDALSGEISYWHHFTSETEMTGLDQALASFAVSQPGITVTPENIPNADYMTQFTTAAVGGALPDAAMAATDRIPDMLALGGLIDLTERFNSWEDKANIADTLMGGSTIDGKIVGIARCSSSSTGSTTARTGSTRPASLRPTTWEEMRAAAIALTDDAAGRYGFGLRGGDGGQGHVLNIMRAYGGLSVDDAGVPVIDRDKAIEAVTFWSGLFTTDKVAPPSAPER